MSPEERGEAAEKARYELFEDWYPRPDRVEAHLKRMSPPKASSLRRRFDYYSQLRREGIESAEAFAASARPPRQDATSHE